MSARGVIEARVCVPLSLERSSWRYEEPVSVGVPFARGVLSGVEDLVVFAGDELALPTQAEPLALWPDGTVRWALVDFMAPAADGDAPRLSLRHAPGGERTAAPALEVKTVDAGVEVATGGFRFVLHGSGSTLLEVERQGDPASRCSCDAFLIEGDGRRAFGLLRSARIAAGGPVRATARLSGELASKEGIPRAELTVWVHLHAGSGLAKIDVMVRNPRAAEHAGGLWDLGDPASLVLRDLGLEWRFADTRPARPYWWLRTEAGEDLAGSGAVEVAQGASGGANWESVNHVDRHGEVRLPFPGFRLRSGSREEEGSRCHPTVAVESASCRVSAALHQFWQLFPKALEAGPEGIRIRLFPTWGEETHELQGGEQKRHTVYVRLEAAAGADGGAGAAAGAGENPLPWAWSPAVVTLPSACYEEAGVFECFAGADLDASSELAALLDGAVGGEASFFAKREVADEYGWRHFGDVYADHERTYYKGDGPLVSHYNNQYDLVYGFLRQAARTGDSRWLRLGADLARHVIDIDIYHTREDRPQYSQGLFWHTDHYVSAGRSTHRCYSKDNARGPAAASYGGGPSNEHCYTSGLLYWYYMTGDPLAREAVVDLADWVVHMDDGRRIILGQLDDGPTGLASQTALADYHGPGRGAGNAIAALLDGFRVTDRRAYLEKAEELIRRCIHPDDRPRDMGFDNIELRWSYLVFLQTLGKYLHLKVERSEQDRAFEFARACLDRYARWMLEDERPYAEVLDRVEYPTETWPAHDFRKSCVFDLATKYGDPSSRDAYREKAEEYFAAATRGLLAFATRSTTRPLAICLGLAGVREWFARADLSAEAFPALTRRFEARPPFVPQKERVKRLARTPGGLLRIALFLSKPSNLRKLLARRLW